MTSSGSRFELATLVRMRTMRGSSGCVKKRALGLMMGLWLLVPVLLLLLCLLLDWTPTSLPRGAT